MSATYCSVCGRRVLTARQTGKCWKHRAKHVATVRSSNFGDWYDFGIREGAIIVAVQDAGRQPVRLMLSHQLYVGTARKLLAEHPGAKGLVVLPVPLKAVWIDVPKPPRERRRVLWCERNESSASAHGHTDDCYRWEG